MPRFATFTLAPMAATSADKAHLQPNILLVDDNRSGLAARRAVLNELGYRTAGALSPHDALKQFESSLQTESPFALVVTDFKMPDLDGIQLIQQLRHLKVDIPIVLVSGFVDALGLTESSTGANAVIMKSAHEVQHLVRAVNRLIGSNARRKPPVRASAPKRGRKSGTNDA